MNEILLILLVVVGLILVVFVISRLYYLYIELRMYKIARAWNEQQKTKTRNDMRGKRR